MEHVDHLLKELQMKHTADYGLLIIALLSLLGAVTRQMTFLYLVSGGAFVLGGLFYYNVYKSNKKLRFIKENYYTDPDACLGIIDQSIKTLERAIAVDQRKADGNGKDANDSRDDVIRKTKKLKTFLAIRNILEPTPME